MYLTDYILHKLNKLNMKFSSLKLTGEIPPLTLVVNWFIYVLTTFYIISHAAHEA